MSERQIKKLRMSRRLKRQTQIIKDLRATIKRPKISKKEAHEKKRQFENLPSKMKLVLSESIRQTQVKDKTKLGDVIQMNG